MNQQIWDAIASKHTLSFRYQNELAARRMEPHAYGVNGEGDEVLLVWQLAGPSDSAPFQPGWRVFSTDDVNEVAVNAESFPGPRPDYRRDGIPIEHIYCCL